MNRSDGHYVIQCNDRSKENATTMLMTRRVAGAAGAVGLMIAEGHPLYLFAGDSAPGQANGNGVNGFGAPWYAMKIGASTTANTSTSGSGGMGGW
jgi:predicted lipoprotein with Yx(FWY)xxD motif